VRPRLGRASSAGSIGCPLRATTPIRGYQYTRTDYQGGQVTFSIHQEPQTCRCPACGSHQVKPRGHVERRFRTGPIGSPTTIVALPIPRVECPTCGVVRQVEVSFADPRRTYARAFERYALELSRSMTIRDVARHLGVGWDTIKGRGSWPNVASAA
jgi:transposase